MTRYVPSFVKQRVLQEEGGECVTPEMVLKTGEFDVDTTGDFDEDIFNENNGIVWQN